ncbi:hypothetical protein [Paenibacillus macerans]|uniref:hypothetical protein n=1 Tax=Paenibacillus macerans TaxID=44252 RepID=UPI00203D10A5|nr:hypothetical protein [Paenibacillus macerans]MCM3701499.1 hypothetical protein [Paenibacillus macerans]
MNGSSLEMDKEAVLVEMKRLKQKADRLLAMSIQLGQPGLAVEAEQLYLEIDRLSVG